MGRLKQDAMGRGLSPCAGCGQLAEDPGPWASPICDPCLAAEREADADMEARREAREQEGHESAAEEHERYGMCQADFYAPDREPL